MYKNCKLLFIGLAMFLFAIQVNEVSASIPLPTMDMKSTSENLKQNMELGKSYYEKAKKVQNAVKKMQNGGFAEGAGDLLYMYESGEFDNIGEDLATFSENTRTAFMSEEELKQKAKEKADKEAEEQKNLMKEAQEKGITYEQLMIEKQKEKELEDAEKRRKRAARVSALKRGMTKAAIAGSAVESISNGDYRSALGSMDSLSGGKLSRTAHGFVRATENYLTGGNGKYEMLDKNGNVIGYVDENGKIFDVNGNEIGAKTADGKLVGSDGKELGTLGAEKKSWAQSIYQTYKKDEDLYNSMLKTGAAVYDSAKEGGSLTEIGKRIADNDEVKDAAKNTADKYKGSSVEQSVNAWQQNRKKKKKDKEMKEKLDELVKSGPVGLPEMEIPEIEMPDKIQSLDELSAGWGGVQ